MASASVRQCHLKNMPDRGYPPRSCVAFVKSCTFDIGSSKPSSRAHSGIPMGQRSGMFLERLGVEKGHDRILTPFAAMHTASPGSSSPVPRLLVGFDLEPIHEPVESTEEIDDGHQLKDAFVVETELPHRGSMDGQSVVTRVHRGNGYRDDLFGKAVQLSIVDHDRLHS